MPTTPPPFGLLLDVDGPIASPVTRTINIPQIVTDLVTLANAGIPVAFITGRSDAFVREQVVAPIHEAGLDPDAVMFAVCEKGAVWFEITAAATSESEMDAALAFQPSAVEAVRSVTERYADAMFFDETKRAMISVEQRTDVEGDAYRPRQQAFESAAFEALTGLGLGVRYGDRSASDAGGDIPYRIDSTIISTDIESVLLDKDHAAERALAFFSARGPLPTAWRSVGDSRSDYLMADHTHAAGYDTAHVDVRPADGVLDRPYPIIEMGDVIHDEAGARFIRQCVESLAR
jgi:hypothetical protein